MLQKNVAGQRVFFGFVKAADGTALTGATAAGVRGLDGAAQAAVTGTFTELGVGQYRFDPSQADTNGNFVGFLFTATGAIPVSANFITIAPTNQTGYPIVDLKYVLGTLSPAPAGRVAVATGILKNTALPKFEFLMTDSTNHLPVTGKAVTVTRSIDNGAFAAGTLSAVTEIGSGIYSVDFGAGDLNGGVITLRATAAGCDDLDVTIVPDP